MFMKKLVNLAEKRANARRTKPKSRLYWLKTKAQVKVMELEEGLHRLRPEGH